MTPLRILIVEDSADDVLLVIHELRRAGYDVTFERVQTSAEIEAALDRNDPWDAVISDYSLPGFSGLDALLLLRERAPDLPFVLVSGQIGEETAVEAMRAGADDYVMKDDLARLAPAVERELREAESRRKRRRAEETLRLQGAALAQVGNAVLVTDTTGRVEWVNEAFTRLTGYAGEEVLGQYRLPTPMNENQGVYKDFWRTVVVAGETWRGELTERRRDGSPLTVLETVTPVRDNGKIGHFVVVQEDITERKEAEARVAHLAHHDPLTDLPNRLLFQDRLDQALARARRAQTLIAVVFLDLDRFKGVNDFYGHAFGDLVLQAAAQRMGGCIRESDTVARIGGDEFAFVIPDLHEPQDAVTVTEKVVRSLSQPLVVEGKSVDVSASAGVALYPLDAIDPDRLIKAADAAVYRAKEGGGGVHRFFTSDMNAESARRIALEKGLRHALDADRLFLEYQPQVDLETGRIVGAEALVRWRCNGTCMPPADFIPVAELSGLILEIDDWVLRTACLQASAWQKTGVPIARMAVNVSARHLREQRLVDVVEEVLGDTGLPADALELELTERVVMTNVEEAISTLRKLRDLGVHVAVDDFGTGYSSLSYLHTLPIDHLKIDRSFVRDLSPREDLGIVPAIIDMGHRLGLNVIAEGVETEPQAALLKKLGCDELQGFLYSPPLSADELLLLPEWNKSWSPLKPEGWEEKSGEPAFLL